jgi:excisionase family DNA binding protein
MPLTDQLTFVANAPHEIKEHHLSGGSYGVSEMAEPWQDQILTIPEVAKYLKVSRSKVYSLVARRTLPYVKMGRNVRIRESDLRVWIEANLVSST